MKPREWTLVRTYSPSFEDCCTILDGPSIGMTKFRVREVSPEIDAAIKDMRTMLVKWQTSDLPAEALCVLSNKVIELYDKAIKRGAE